MKSVILSYLRCPQCFNNIIKNDNALKCETCNSVYAIRNGIPQLFIDIKDKSKTTAERFGYQWNLFADLDEESRNLLLDWIYPLDENVFKGKRVLDAGCGNARLLLWAVNFGASEVVGVDYGGAVEIANAKTIKFDNVRIIQGDLRRIPVTSYFDYVYCIGVLHHLPDPEVGFKNILHATRDGGIISIWIYAKEGNELVIKFIDPLRKIISSFPPFYIRPIAFFLSLFAYFLAKLIYLPISKLFPNVYNKLPMHAYIRTWITFPFRIINSIVYDQLITPITHYISKTELEEWMKRAEIKNFLISSRAGNGWRVMIQK